MIGQCMACGDDVHDGAPYHDECADGVTRCACCGDLHLKEDMAYEPENVEWFCQDDACAAAHLDSIRSMEDQVKYARREALDAALDRVREELYLDDVEYLHAQLREMGLLRG